MDGGLFAAGCALVGIGVGSIGTYLIIRDTIEIRVSEKLLDMPVETLKAVLQDKIAIRNMRKDAYDQAKEEVEALEKGRDPV